MVQFQKTLMIANKYSSDERIFIPVLKNMFRFKE